MPPRLHRRAVVLAQILALFLVATAAAGSLTSPPSGAAVRSAPRLRFEPLVLPAQPAGQPRPAAVAFDGQRWWVAGAILDTAGVHRPGLWWSTDARTWTQTATVPRTGYGEISELYTLAATRDGLVAIGAATGGAHGNPRTVSWVLGPDALLHEVPASFELYNGPRQIGVRTISRASGGWVIVGTRVNRNGTMGATSWTSASGDDFTIHDADRALSSGPDEQVQGLDVVLDGDHLVAVGERFATGSGYADTDAIAWTSPDGVTWSRWAPAGLDLGGPGAQRAQRVSAEGGRLIIAGTRITDRAAFVAWTRTSPAGPWRRSVIGPLGTSDDVLSNASATLIDASGFYVGSRTGEVLRLAHSSDGRVWTGVPLPGTAPTGDRARMSLAEGNGIVVLAARSQNGGGLWRADAVG